MLWWPAMLAVGAAAAQFPGDWPRTDAAARVDGDILIGALMMVHERGEGHAGCGKVMVQGGVQAVEAMLYTLREVNRRRLLGVLPHSGQTIRLGGLILDDCDTDSYGLQQSLKFVKSYMSDKVEDSKCRAADERPISGVVGAASSVTSIQVANLLKLFALPQVSFFSSSSELANEGRFPFFFRTIPSDENQVEAMVAILRNFNWTFVGILYEESVYGKSAYNALEKKLGEHGICVGFSEQLWKDRGVADYEKYKALVGRMEKERRDPGPDSLRTEGTAMAAVIVYGSDQEVQVLMKAVQEVGTPGLFTWIGSDGWSGRSLVTQGNEAAVLGAINVQPIAEPIPGFEEYFKNLSLHEHTINPWFYEMWEWEHKCRALKFPRTPYNDFDKNCTGLESLDSVLMEYQLQFVSDAVLALAMSIRQYLHGRCKGIPAGYSEQMEECLKNQFSPRTLGDRIRIPKLNGTRLTHVLRNISFTGFAGNEFRFFGNGAPARYRLIHFVNSTEGYRWIDVGNYTEGNLFVDKSKLEFNINGINPGEVPESVCSKACKPGSRQIRETKMPCCWYCDACTGRHYVANSTQCAECPRGQHPTDDRMGCAISALETVEIFSAYAVVSLILAFIGVLTTCSILAIFIRNNDTPIIKASGRELSYVIIIGLFLSFMMTPLMLQTPTTAVCGLQRFMSGFCFTIIYAGILTKANRIARIFRSGKRTSRRPNFISPQSQIVICCAIASVQLLICACWMYFRPPAAIDKYPTLERRQRVCAESVHHSYLVTYIYPIFLCVICTVYAIQTRHIPEAFNESKYIGVAVYTTCVIWLAFVPIYFVVIENIPIRVTSVCISTSLTAVVCQACLFYPKCYIIIFRPERNVRQAVMGPKSSSIATKNSTYMSTARSESSEGHSDAEENLLEPLNNTPRILVSAAVQTSPVGKHAPLAYINSLNDGDVQL